MTRSRASRARPGRAATPCATVSRDGKPFEAALDRAVERALGRPIAGWRTSSPPGCCAGRRRSTRGSRRWCRAAGPASRRSFRRCSGSARFSSLRSIGFLRTPRWIPVSRWPRRPAAQRAGGFVNAVLRRLGQAGRRAGWLGTSRCRGVRRRTALATAASHPTWLVERWLERFGPEDTSRAAPVEQHAAPSSCCSRRARARGTARARGGGRPASRSSPAPFGAGLMTDRSRPQSLPGYARGRLHRAGPGAGAAGLVRRPAVRRHAVRRVRGSRGQDDRLRPRRRPGRRGRRSAARGARGWPRTFGARGAGASTGRGRRTPPAGPAESTPCWSTRPASAPGRSRGIPTRAGG